VNTGEDIPENEKHKRGGCHWKKRIPFTKDDKDKKWEEGGNTKEFKNATHIVRYYRDMLDALHLLIPVSNSSKYSYMRIEYKRFISLYNLFYF